MCVRFSLYFISNVSRIIYTTYGGGGGGAYGLNGLLGQIDFPVAIVQRRRIPCSKRRRCGFGFVQWVRASRAQIAVAVDRDMIARNKTRVLDVAEYT